MRAILLWSITELEKENTMKGSEWITIAALLLGPIVAVQISEWLGRRRAQRERQLYIFRTLLATRMAKVSRDHVGALNMIDVEFFGKKPENKAVLEAWKIYLDHLNTKPEPLENWTSKGTDLFVDLLHSMATFLGYDFDKVHLNRSCYAPIAHGNWETEEQTIRKGLVDLFSKKSSLYVQLTEAKNGGESPKPVGFTS